MRPRARRVHSLGRSTPAGAAIALALLLAVPLASGAGTGPSVGRPAVPAPSEALPASTAPSELPLVHALNLSGSFDWDGMGFLYGPGIPSAYVGGEGAGLVIDDPLKTGVLFGGEGPFGLTNLSLAVNETTAAWQNVTSSVAPSPRTNFSFATDPAAGFAVLFGGLTSLRTQACDNQTWIYWFANQTWENVTRAVAPPPRESAAFAVDAGNATAVIEGGIDPAYVAGGASGTVVWNDTWTLNLTTFNWTVQHPRAAPSPYFGSSMAWVPPVHSFLLFGGCFTGCTNAMWSYLPGGNWSVVRPNGTAPSGRAATTLAWGPDYGVLAMYGGFSLLGQSREAHNDTYVYQPVPREWSWVQGPPDPFRRFAAPGAWLSANNCPGLFLVGGSTAVVSSPPDEWFMDSNPDTQSGCNAWGNDQVGGNSGGGNSGGLPPGCVADANVSVLILSSSTRLGIPNATVDLSGYCGPYSAATNATGVANFTDVPAWLTVIAAQAAGYHSNRTSENFTPNATSFVTLNLTPLPVVILRALGVQVGGGIAPLAGVPIWIDGNPTANVTGPGGWWNVTGLNLPLGPNTFSAELPGYSEPSATVFFPYTGVVHVNLTLFAFGPFTVVVRVNGTTFAIPGATGTIAPVDPNATGGLIPFTTSANGSVSLLLAGGNYTVQVSAAGFAANGTPVPVFHGWANATLVQVNLSPLETFRLYARLLDASTHRPIGNGTIELGSSLVERTSYGGWANFSHIAPAGTYGVLGSAPGYTSNRTSVAFSYLRPPSIAVELNLTPLSSCPAGNCPGGPNGTSAIFALVPPGFWGLAFLTTAPLLLIVGAIAYLAGTRRRSGAEGRA